VATYTRLESPSLEPRFAAGRRSAASGAPRSRWETVLASGFVDERRRSAAVADAPAAGVRPTPSRHASSACVAPGGSTARRAKPA
jgi:hypothetical protein